MEGRKIGKCKEAIIDALIYFPIFNGISGSDLSILADHMNYFEIAKEQIHFREGEKGDSIDNFPGSATVRARQKTSYITLTKAGFEKILKDSPQIGILILKGISRLLSQNLRKTSSRLADYMLPVS